MFAVDVAVVDAANGGHATDLAIAVIANKLGHRPGLQRRPMRAQPRKVANQYSDELALVLPEIEQQLPLFFRRQEIGGKDGGGGINGSRIPWRRLALTLLGL